MKKSSAPPISSEQSSEELGRSDLGVVPDFYDQSQVLEFKSHHNQTFDNMSDVVYEKTTSPEKKTKSVGIFNSF